MCRFTSKNLNSCTSNFSDGYLFFNSNQETFGSYLMGRSRGLQTWYPWMTTQSYAKNLSDLYKVNLWENNDSLHPMVKGVISFFEPQGRHTIPPFSRRLHPKPNDTIYHSSNFEGDLFLIHQELTPARKTRPYFQFWMELRSYTLSEETDKHHPLYPTR